MLNRARTSVLEIAYEESGPADGVAVLLMHGFPYDPRTYDHVVPSLVHAGCRVIVPYLRGYGPTRFLARETPRSGQQAALGNDLKELMDALALERVVLAGYDWGGRAACIVAALWPERVRGLVSANGYNIQDIAASAKPASAEQEHRLWYQYYFHTERGRAGLAANRREFCRFIWQLWSPNWRFDNDAHFGAENRPSRSRLLPFCYHFQFREHLLRGGRAKNLQEIPIPHSNKGSSGPAPINGKARQKFSDPCRVPPFSKIRQTDLLLWGHPSGPIGPEMRSFAR